MDEKIYCSQCHNSVFVQVTKSLREKNQVLHDQKICLYCAGKDVGRYLHKDCHINFCPQFVPESRQKLLDGSWHTRKKYKAK